MATELFLKEDVYHKCFTIITDSSGCDLHANLKQCYKKLQKPSENYIIVILGIQHMLIHMEQLQDQTMKSYKYAIVHKNKHSFITYFLEIVTI